MKVRSVKRDPSVAGMGDSVCSSKTFLYNEVKKRNLGGKTAIKQLLTD